MNFCYATPDKLKHCQYEYGFSFSSGTCGIRDQLLGVWTFPHAPQIVCFNVLIVLIDQSQRDLL